MKKQLWGLFCAAVLAATLAAKTEYARLSDGEVALRIGEETLLMKVENGRASVSAEVSAAPAAADPAVVYHDLPWSDEETVLHAVLFVGHKLVGHTPFSRGARERVNVDFRYDGPALDIKSEFSVICGANTTVAGDVNAGDGVQCGNVLGHVNAGDSVTCGNVDGNVHAGDSVECRDVEGGVTAGDGVRCGNIRGRVVAGDSVTCTGLAPDKA